MSIVFPLPESLFIVMEPDNFDRMKELEPFTISVPARCKRIGIIYTPDLLAFQKELKMPATAETITDALMRCKKLPEKRRLKMVDGINRKEQ